MLKILCILSSKLLSSKLVFQFEHSHTLVITIKCCFSMYSVVTQINQ